jgi:hypothetical protein
MSELVYDTDVSGVTVTLIPTISVTLATPTVSYTLATLPESPTVPGVPIDSPTTDISGVITDILSMLPDSPTISDISGTALVRVPLYAWCMRLIRECLRPTKPLTSLPPVMRD